MKGLFVRIMNSNDTMYKPHRIKGLYLCTESDNSIAKRLPVNQWLPITREPNISGYGYRYIKCFHCGHTDFNEDTNDINELSCNGCTELIKVEYV